MGTSSPPSTREAGTVYFRAHDSSDLGYGTIYYDDADGNRKEIIPTNLDCGIEYATDCCFIAGTKILMHDYSYKNIEQIKKGDHVISYDIQSDKFYEAIVNGLIINPNTKNMAIITFEDNSSLEMNEYHPIYTECGFHSLTNHNGYTTLKVGDLAKTLDGYKKIINIHCFTCKNPMITYNLDIRDLNEQNDNDSDDTFIANNIIVHNASCPT